MTRRTIDVSSLPTFAFGSRSLVWWGTLAAMIVEGSVFILALISYFYLQGEEYTWPPGAAEPPGLLFGTINTLILLVSAAPNQWLKKQTEKLDLKKTQLGLLIAVGFALAFLVVRAFEFTRLEIRWDTNAYGSILWTLLGLHTAHLLTDAFDTVVLTAMMFAHPVEKRRFVDVSENCLYWDFVVLMWLPIYFVVYIYPRF